jgi:hypothetical protein
MPAASRFGAVGLLSRQPREARSALAVLTTLAAAAGIIAVVVPGPDYGQLPVPGLHLPLAGVWFALVVAFAVWRWGQPPQAAGPALRALATTWIGWETAVNLAMLVDQRLARVDALPLDAAMALAGFAAGALGALLTWAGVAAAGRALRRPQSALAFAAVGAALGLLLPLANRLESFTLLLVPWQMAIAALIAIGLAGGERR